MEIIFATANKHKLVEAQAITGERFKLISSADAGITEDIEETGITLMENALIKAEYIWGKTGRWCFADDTGLEIDALDGRPGVYSARYAGEHCSFMDNIDKVLSEMDGVTNRKARFKTVIALITGEEPLFFEGSVEGQILTVCKGEKGFGYDPVFLPDGFDKTMAQMSEDEKNSISHRGIAMRKMAQYLRTIYCKY
jgi:XTP/dITP diphosphohydrolase